MFYYSVKQVITSVLEQVKHQLEPLAALIIGVRHMVIVGILTDIVTHHHHLVLLFNGR